MIKHVRFYHWIKKCDFCGHRPIAPALKGLPRFPKCRNLGRLLDHNDAKWLLWATICPQTLFTTCPTHGTAIAIGSLTCTSGPLHAKYLFATPVALMPPGFFFALGARAQRSAQLQLRKLLRTPAFASKCAAGAARSDMQWEDEAFLGWFAI
jgi:hypothetical protein